MIFMLHSMSSEMEECKGIGVKRKPLSIFRRRFLKLLAIAIGKKKYFDASCLQLFAHLLGVIDGIFEFSNIIVGRNSDNKCTYFLSRESKGL